MWLNIYRCLMLAAVIIEVSFGQSPREGTRQFSEERGARSLKRAKRSPAPFFDIFGNGFFRRPTTRYTPATHSFGPISFVDSQNQLHSTQNKVPHYFRSNLNARGSSNRAAIGARRYQRPSQFRKHPVNTPIQTNIFIDDFGYTAERPCRPFVSYNNVKNWVNDILWGTSTSSTYEAPTQPRVQGTGKIPRKKISRPTMWNSPMNWINEMMYGPRVNPTLRPDQQWIQSTKTMRPERPTTGRPADGCILPEQPVGGRYEVDQCIKPCSLVAGTKVPVGSILNYNCKEGFALDGSNTTFCGAHNMWYMPPTCIKTCYALKSNSVDIVCRYNGRIVSCESKIMPGTKATLACKDSYKIPPGEDLGFREITCLEGGLWDRALFRCHSECGKKISHANISIGNGFTAVDVILPWHVAIYVLAVPTRQWVPICAGTLVSPNLVISAADCFYDEAIDTTKHPSNFVVAARKHNRLYNWPERLVQKSLVKRIDVPSGYHRSSENRPDDIALVILQTSFNLSALVKPICVDWENRYENENLQAGRIGMTAGWGQSPWSEFRMELEETNLINVPYHNCASAVQDNYRDFVISNKFCAGGLNGSICDVDSGAGLDFEVNGTWYLRGIISVSPLRASRCESGNYIPVINIRRYTDWIRDASTFSV